jgi:hypothetical protein
VPKYSARLPIPALTPSTSPVSTSFIVKEKIMTSFEVYFPPGCAALPGIAILLNGLQIAPDPGSSDAWFRGEGSITWFGRRMLGEGGTNLVIKIVGYNDDDSYQHTPLVRLDTEEGS